MKVNEEKEKLQSEQKLIENETIKRLEQVIEIIQ
jgi:hypothetical protein